MDCAVKRFVVVGALVVACFIGFPCSAFALSVDSEYQGQCEKMSAFQEESEGILLSACDSLEEKADGSMPSGEEPCNADGLLDGASNNESVEPGFETENNADLPNASEVDLPSEGAAADDGEGGIGNSIDCSENATSSDTIESSFDSVEASSDQSNQSDGGQKPVANKEDKISATTSKDTSANTKTTLPASSKKPDAHVSYSTHVQNVGWQSYVKDGKTAGTSGKALRLEGIKILLVDSKGNRLSGSTGGIQYQVHVQNIGWQAVTGNNHLAGTSGKSLRLEAIRIMLTGKASQYYDVLYRTHVQNIGWQDWVKNGAMAGTSGKGYRLEGIQVKLREKEKPSSASSDGLTGVRYCSYVSGSGWQGAVQNSTVSGTSGKGLPIDALCVYLDDGIYSGNVEYRAYTAGKGWSAWKDEGATAGFAGRGYGIEAFQMRLNGDIAQKYDIAYRAHVQNIGWQPWTVGGGVESGKPTASGLAGELGKGLKVEALQVKLVKKGAASVSEGAYFIASAVRPSLAVDVPLSSTQSGKQLQLSPYSDDFDQRYLFQKVKSGIYRIQSVRSAMFLTDAGGKLLQQNLDTSSEAQKWKLSWNGGYVLMNAKTGKAMAVSGAKLVDGAKMCAKTTVSGSSTRWMLTKTSMIPDGVYAIVNTESNEALDVTGWKRTNGANVASAARDGGNKQKFQITHLGNETYSIRNVVTGRAVEVEQSSKNRGANVRMYSWKGTANQKWKAVLTGPARFQFENVNSRLLLSRASSAPKANIVQTSISSSNTGRQEYKLISTSRVREVIRNNVPAVWQNPQLPTGCESVALTEALKYYGFGLGKTTIADYYMPWSSTDFVYSFLGNPHSTSGFMICAPGITNAANSYLQGQGSSLRATNRTGSSFENLLTYVDRGVPVVVWSTMYMMNRGPAQLHSHGYTAYSNTHAVTIAGYDPFAKQVLVADPLSGLVWRDQARFKSLYNQMGRQAVTIE